MFSIRFVDKARRQSRGLTRHVSTRRLSRGWLGALLLVWTGTTGVLARAQVATDGTAIGELPSPKEDLAGCSAWFSRIYAESAAKRFTGAQADGVSEKGQPAESPRVWVSCASNTLGLWAWDGDAPRLLRTVATGGLSDGEAAELARLLAGEWRLYLAGQGALPVADPPEANRPRPEPTVVDVAKDKPLAIGSNTNGQAGGAGTASSAKTTNDTPSAAMTDADADRPVTGPGANASGRRARFSLVTGVGQHGPDGRPTYSGGVGVLLPLTTAPDISIVWTKRRPKTRLQRRARWL